MTFNIRCNTYADNFLPLCDLTSQEKDDIKTMHILKVLQSAMTWRGFKWTNNESNINKLNKNNCASPF